MRVPAEIPGEQHGPAGAFELHGRGRGPEDVSRVAEHDVHPGDQLDTLTESGRPEHREGEVRVGRGVERERGMVLGVTLAVGVVRLLLLEPSRVLEHDLGQLGGRGGAEHRAGEAVAGQGGQVPDVVEVRMGHHDRVDARRIHRERRPVAEPELLVALEHPAVDEDAAVTVLDQEPAAGHGAGGAEEVDQGGAVRHGLTFLAGQRPDQGRRPLREPPLTTKGVATWDVRPFRAPCPRGEPVAMERWSVSRPIHRPTADVGDPRTGGHFHA